MIDVESFEPDEHSTRELIDALREQVKHATAQRAAFKSLVEIWEADILNITDVIEDLEATFPDEKLDCDHEWIDARNSVVVSGYYCRLCGRMKEGPKHEGRNTAA